MAYDIEIIASDNNITGEAPLWDYRTGEFYWSDIDGGFFYRLNTCTGHKTVLLEGENVFGVALNSAGGLVFSGMDGLRLWEGPGRKRTIAGECEGEPIPLNDITAAPDGGVYGGTFFWGENGMEKPGRLIRFGPDGSVSVQDEGILLSNGLAVSPDDRTLYFSDSAQRIVFAYDIHSGDGSLSNRRVFANFEREDGIPDGLTVDSLGNVYCALWYGSKIAVISPEGDLVETIGVPVTQVSSVAFGGKDLTDLYITSAGGPWPSELAPASYDINAPVGGALYCLKRKTPGVRERLTSFPPL